MQSYTSYFTLILVFNLLPLKVPLGNRIPDVGGKEVVHLVPERRLAEEPAAAYKVANGDVEIVTARAPVTDLGERVHLQDFLGPGEWPIEIVWVAEMLFQTH